MRILLLLAFLQDGPFDPEKEEIRLRIEALGSDEIERRDDAMATLAGMGDVAHPQLREGLQHPDPEVRTRCRILLQGPAFEPGARILAGVGVDVPDMRPDPERKKRYEALAAAGKSDVILREDHAWVPCIIDGVLSDQRAVAQTSLRVLHRLIRKRSLEPFGECAKGTLDLHALASAELRASEYSMWAQWWFTKAARDRVAAWSEEKPNPLTEDWESTLRQLRGAGRLDDPAADGFEEVERIRAMGEKAYPCIVRYLDHEDVTIGRSALELLKRLTGRKERPLTEENKGDLRAEWLAWLHDNR